VRTDEGAVMVARIIAPLICPRFKCDRDLISPSKIDILQTETPLYLSGLFRGLNRDAAGLLERRPGQNGAKFGA